MNVSIEAGMLCIVMDFCDGGMNVFRINTIEVKAASIHISS